MAQPPQTSGYGLMTDSPDDYGLSKKYINENRLKTQRAQQEEAARKRRQEALDRHLSEYEDDPISKAVATIEFEKKEADDYKAAQKAAIEKEHEKIRAQYDDPISQAWAVMQYDDEKGKNLAAKQAFADQEAIDQLDKRDQTSNKLDRVGLGNAFIRESIGSAVNVVPELAAVPARAMEAVGLAEPGTADELHRQSNAFQDARQKSREGDMSPWLSRMYGGASQSLLQTFATPGGAYSKIAGSGVMAGSQGLTTAEDAGLEGTDRLRYAGTQALLEAGIAAIGQKFLGGGIESRLAGQAVAAQTWKKLGENIGMDAVKEMPEEWVTSVLQNVSNKLEGVSPNMTFGDFVTESTEAVVQAAMMAPMTNAPNAGRLLMRGRQPVPVQPEAERERGKMIPIEEMIRRRDAAEAGESVVPPEVEAFSKTPSRKNYDAAVKAGLPPIDKPNRDGRAKYATDLLKDPFGMRKPQPTLETSPNIPPEPVPEEAPPATNPAPVQDNEYDRLLSQFLEEAERNATQDETSQEPETSTQGQPVQGRQEGVLTDGPEPKASPVATGEPSPGQSPKEAGPVSKPDAESSQEEDDLRWHEDNNVKPKIRARLSAGKDATIGTIKSGDGKITFTAGYGKAADDIRLSPTKEEIKKANAFVVDGEFAETQEERDAAKKGLHEVLRNAVQRALAPVSKPKATPVATGVPSPDQSQPLTETDSVSLPEQEPVEPIPDALRKELAKDKDLKKAATELGVRLSGDKETDLRAIAENQRVFATVPDIIREVTAGVSRENVFESGDKYVEEISSRLPTSKFPIPPQRISEAIEALLSDHEPETPTEPQAEETWWDKSLTGAGRANILKQVGLMLPSKVLWKNMKPAAQAKVRHMMPTDGKPAEPVKVTEPSAEKPDKKPTTPAKRSDLPMWGVYPTIFQGKPKFSVKESEKSFGDTLWDTEAEAQKHADISRKQAEDRAATLAKLAIKTGKPPETLDELLEQFQTSTSAIDKTKAAALGVLVRGVAKYRGMSPDEYVKQRFAGVVSGGTPAEGALFSRASSRLAARLESGKKVKLYRAMQLIDGKLYPPMAAKVDGKMVDPTEIGTWEVADERPDLVRGGKFKLDKANGTSLTARYNPYFHTSRSPLNDQFSSAHKRDNLVTVEVEVPESELTSGYKAEGAKDAVGEMSWNSGPVSSKLPPSKKRKVILSRYAKVTRIVPDSEVASVIAQMLKGEGIRVPANVVTPSLRSELEKRGVNIAEVFNQTRAGIVRASVEFNKDARALIRALNSTNIADMVHELGHIFRRDLSAADMAAVEKWAGVINGKWTEAAEELWATGFERYLAEGKAPTSSMKGVFAQFKEWLADIYGAIIGSDIDVNVSDEVKEIMERLVSGPKHTDPKAAAKFRKLADGMEKVINDKRQPMTQNATPKRMKEYGIRRNDAEQLEYIQEALRVLADAHEAGSVPAVLKDVNSKVSVAKLIRHVEDHSRGGYYDAGHVTQNYTDTTPTGIALQELVSQSKQSPEQAQARKDREKAVALERLEEKVRFSNIPGFFPTPKAIVDRMLEEADIQAGMSVLEPSAGKGDIADAIRAAGVEPVTVESNHTLAEILTAKGYEVSGSDFLEHAGKYDRVIMNPPFENGMDIDHVRHAFDSLKPGGRVVAIMSEGSFGRSDKKATAFREWLDGIGGLSEKLDAGSFTGAKAFRQTGVSTRIVTIDLVAKPAKPKQEDAKPVKAEDDVDKTLRQAGLKVEQLADGTWQITGNTYEHSKEIGDVKRQLPELGGRWDKDKKRWTFKRDPQRELSNRIAGKGTGEESANAVSRDEQVAREDARREQEARPDAQRPSGDYVANVAQATKDLIARGLNFGMTQEVVDNQIEDIGMVVDAAESNRKMFMIGSAPGTGKTFVLGGVIRELRRRGFDKFVYVTQNQNLISQVQGNLADYGLEGVEFTTYTKARSAAPSTSGAVLLLDEAHSAKNIDLATGKAVRSMVSDSRFTVYATATPFENVTEADYLASSGLFDGIHVEFDRPSNRPGKPFRNTLDGFAAWAWTYGANVYFVKNRSGGLVPVVWWKKHQTAEQDQLAANEWLQKRGVYVQRPMSLPAGTVNSEMRGVDADPYWADISNEVVQIYADAESEAENNVEAGQIKAHKVNVLKRLLEASKVDAAIARAKELIGDGKKDDPQVIIFVNTKVATDLGTYTLSEPYRKERGIKGKEAGRRYTPAEVDRMMQSWYEAKAAAKRMGETAGPPPFAPFIHKIAMAMDRAGVLKKFPSVIDKIMDQFPGQAVEFSGRTPSQNDNNLAKWKNNEAKLIVATMDKGGTGLSFHDTTGTMPSRYQVNMNLPWSGTKVEQVSGRLARYGTAKPVTLEWLFANNIPFDRELSKTVGSRMRSMSAAVQGRNSGDAKQIQDFDFEDLQPEAPEPAPIPASEVASGKPVGETQPQETSGLQSAEEQARKNLRSRGKRKPSENDINAEVESVLRGREADNSVRRQIREDMDAEKAQTSRREFIVSLKSKANPATVDSLGVGDISQVNNDIESGRISYDDAVMAADSLVSAGYLSQFQRDKIQKPVEAKPSATEHDRLYKELQPLYRDPKHKAGDREHMERISDLEQQVEFHKPAAVARAQAEIDAESIAAPAEAATDKEPWQMTPQEYTAGRTVDARAVGLAAHSGHVKKAVADGLPVPREVLEKYKANGWAATALEKLDKPEPATPEPKQPDPEIPAFTRTTPDKSSITRTDRDDRVRQVRESVTAIEGRIKAKQKEHDGFRKNATKMRGTAKRELNNLQSRKNDLEKSIRRDELQSNIANLEDAMESPRSYDHYLAGMAAIHKANANIDEAAWRDGSSSREASQKGYTAKEKESDKFRTELLARAVDEGKAQGLNEFDADRAADTAINGFSVLDDRPLSYFVERAANRIREDRMAQPMGKLFPNQNVYRGETTKLSDAQRDQFAEQLREASKDDENATAKISAINKKIDQAIQTIRDDAAAVEKKKSESAAEEKAQKEQEELKNARERAKRYFQTERINKALKKQTVKTKPVFVRQDSKNGPVTIVQGARTDGDTKGELYPNGLILHPSFAEDSTDFALTHKRSGLAFPFIAKKSDMKGLLGLIDILGIDFNVDVDSDRHLPSDLIARITKVNTAWENDDYSKLSEQDSATVEKLAAVAPTDIQADLILTADDLGANGIPPGMNTVMTARGVKAIKDMANEVAEFAYDPVFTFQDGKLVYRDGYTFKFAPQVFNVHPSELTEGQTVGINLEDLGIKRATPQDVVADMMKNAGLTNVKKSKSGRDVTVGYIGATASVQQGTEDNDWSVHAGKGKVRDTVIATLKKIRWRQPGQTGEASTDINEGKPETAAVEAVPATEPTTPASAPEAAPEPVAQSESPVSEARKASDEANAAVEAQKDAAGRDAFFIQNQKKKNAGYYRDLRNQWNRFKSTPGLGAAITPELLRAAGNVVVGEIRLGAKRFSVLIEKLRREFDDTIVNHLKPTLIVMWNANQEKYGLDDASPELFDEAMSDTVDVDVEKTIEAAMTPEPASNVAEDERTYSTKNAYTDAERQRLDMPERPPVETQSRQPSIDLAAEIGKTKAGADRIDKLIVELKQFPRAVNPLENDLLNYRYAELDARVDDALQAKYQAEENGDDTQAAVNDQIVRESMQAQQDLIQFVDEPIGTAAGRALQARKAVIKRDFTMARSLLLFKATHGREADPDGPEYAAMKKQIDDLNAAIAALDEKLAAADAKANDLETRLKESHDTAVSDVNTPEPTPAPTPAAPPSAPPKATSVIEKLAEEGKDDVNRGFKRLSAMLGKAYSIEAVGQDIALAFIDIAKGYSKQGVVKLADFLNRVGKRMGPDAKKYTEQMIAAWKHVRSTLGPDDISRITDKIDIIDPETIGRAARDLHRYVIERDGLDASADGRDAAVSAVYEILVDIIPEITADEVARAMSGIGIYSELSQDEIDVIRRDQKAQLLSLEQIADWKKGTPPPATGQERAPVSDEQRLLRRMVNEAKKASGVDHQTEGQLSSALSAAKRMAQNRITDLTNALSPGGDRIKRSKTVLKSDTELDALRAERDALQYLYDEVYGKNELTDEQRISRTETMLDRAILGLESDLKKGRLYKDAKQRSPVTSHAIEAKKAALDALKASREEMRLQSGEAQARSDAAFERHLTEKIATLAKRLAEKDYAPKPKKPEREFTPEMLADMLTIEKMKQEINRERKEWEFSQRHIVYRTWMKGPVAGAHMVRKGLTSIDQSLIGRQGGLLGVTNPKIWAKAGRKAFASNMIDAKSIFTTEQDLFNTEAALDADARWVRMEKIGKLAVTGVHGGVNREEDARFVPEWFDKLPGIGGSERAGSAFINTQRRLVFRSLVDKLATKLDGKRSVSNAELRVIANFVNVSSGRGTIGAYTSALDSVTTVFFSPRWWASRINVLSGQPIWHGAQWTGENGASAEVRKMIAVEWAKQAAGQVAIMGIAVAALTAAFGAPGDDEEWDWYYHPKSPKFGNIRIGSSYVDLTFGLGQHLSYLVRMLTGQQIDRWETRDIRSGELFGKYMRGKLAPVASVAGDYLVGKSIGGEEFGSAEWFKSHVTPLMVQDIEEASTEGPILGTALSLLMFFGANSQTYDARVKERKDIANELRAMTKQGASPDKIKTTLDRHLAHAAGLEAKQDLRTAKPEDVAGLQKIIDGTASPELTAAIQKEKYDIILNASGRVSTDPKRLNEDKEFSGSDDNSRMTSRSLIKSIAPTEKEAIALYEAAYRAKNHSLYETNGEIKASVYAGRARIKSIYKQ